jgi:CRISPR-associated endonuclease/helicase Cas3
VYGPALGATWQWLNELPSDVDFGISGLAVPADAAERGLLAPRPHAPILLPSHLDAWVQTSPIPTPDPDVTLWLHGPDRGVADVQIVWRADLTAELLRSAAGVAQDPRPLTARDVALGIVEAMPPASGEAMPVPFFAVKRWLDGRAEPDVSDVEGASAATPDDEWKETPERLPRPAVAWRGDASDIIDASGLRPGDTVVVPASYGGIACGTWAVTEGRRAGRRVGQRAGRGEGQVPAILGKKPGVRTGRLRSGRSPCTRVQAVRITWAPSAR